MGGIANPMMLQNMVTVAGMRGYKTATTTVYIEDSIYQ